MWRVATNGLWRVSRGGVDLTLSAGVRVMSAPATSAVAAELLNADQMIFAIPLERVQSHVGTAPVRLSRWGGPTITLGVRVR